MGKAPRLLCRGASKMGALLPGTFRLLNWPGESGFTIYLGTAGTNQTGIENLIFWR